MKSSVWHPNTQMKEWTEFEEITHGKDMWLITKNGEKYLDGVASMWCNVWGHSKKQLIDEIIKQAKKNAHSSLFNLTNEPVEKLARKLIKLSPGMEKVFFSDNGSTAMEIAFKIALQYWNNVGKKNKNVIMTLENGYHGDTFGAMSVGYVPDFFSKFKDKLFSTIQVPVPNAYRIPKNNTIKEEEERCLNIIETHLKKNKRIAAFVMESGAQMAGGVIIYPKNFQNQISRLCKKYNVLFIVDEIATGFGRLGSMIEYDAQNSRPDIVAYGKMLTGGCLTLGVTLTSKKIYNSFLGKFYEYKHLFHGHTFTGNPISAAVALKNLEMYEDKKLIKQIQKTSQVFFKRKKELERLPLVGDVRFKGMVMGIELVKDISKKIPVSPKSSINKIVFEEGKRNGVYLRTLGNIVMIVPPLAISQTEMNWLIDKTMIIIKNVKKSLE